MFLVYSPQGRYMGRYYAPDACAWETAGYAVEWEKRA